MRSDTAQRPAARVVGILAGGGELPREIADSLLARGLKVVVVAVEGEADGDFTGLPTARLGWGKVGRMLATFRRAGARDVVIVGKVRRPDLRKLRPDLGFLLGLPEIARLIAGGGGDDRVLRGIVGFFERRGFRVVGLEQVAPHLIVGKGLAGRAHPTSGDVADMGLAAALLAALAPFDIGQGAVVASGRLEAIEAAENTDAMLERVAKRRRAEGHAARRGVLVKLVKRGQERRIDLPAIGRQTVLGAVAAGLSGIGVEAGGVVAVGREDMMARADAAGLFVAGIEPVPGDASAGAVPKAAETGWRLLAGSKSGGRASGKLLADARKGAAVVAAAVPFSAGRAVVVSRRHVLGVEAGEGVEALLARVAGLRQWGSEGSRRRAGVVALAHTADLTPGVMTLAAQAGLAAVVLTKADGAAVSPDMLAAAAAARLSLIAPTVTETSS